MNSFELYKTRLQPDVKVTLEKANEMLLEASSHAKDLEKLSFENAYVQEELNRAKITYDRLVKLDGMLTNENASELIIGEAKFIEDITGLPLGDITREGAIKDGMVKIWEGIMKAIKYMVKKLKEASKKISKLFSMLTSKVWKKKKEEEANNIKSFEDLSSVLGELVNKLTIHEMAKEKGPDFTLVVNDKTDNKTEEPKTEETPAVKKVLDKTKGKMKRLSVKANIVSEKLRSIEVKDEDSMLSTELEVKEGLTGGISYEEAYMLYGDDLKDPSKLLKVPYLAIKDFSSRMTIPLTDFSDALMNGELEKLVKDSTAKLKEIMKAVEKGLASYNHEEIANIDISNSNLITVSDYGNYSKIEKLSDLNTKSNYSQSEPLDIKIGGITKDEPKMNIYLDKNNEKRIKGLEKELKELIDFLYSDYDDLMAKFNPKDTEVPQPFFDAMMAVSAFGNSMYGAGSSIPEFIYNIQEVSSGVNKVQAEIKLLELTES